MNPSKMLPKNEAVLKKRFPDAYIKIMEIGEKMPESLYYKDTSKGSQLFMVHGEYEYSPSKFFPAWPAAGASAPAAALPTVYVCIIPRFARTWPGELGIVLASSAGGRVCPVLAPAAGPAGAQRQLRVRHARSAREPCTQLVDLDMPIARRLFGRFDSSKARSGSIRHRRTR